MKHRGVLITPIIFAVAGGCSTAPRQDDVTRKTTYEVVDQIRCEAQRAVIDYGGYYKTAAVAYEFSFEINEENNNSLLSTWQKPFLNGDVFSLGASAGLNLARNTVRTFKIVDTFDQLKALKCGDTPLSTNISYPISGDIGVYEVVSTFIRLQNVTIPKAGEVFTFADKLRFITQVSGGISPKLILIPVTGRFGLAEGIGSFGASRSDVHQVTITLSGTRPNSLGTNSRPALGSSLELGPIGLGSNSSLISTTLLQAGADPKDRALIELDRQRILELQSRDRNLNLLVGP